MDGNLIFGSANQPQGFLNLAMAKWDGNPEPIVREMLQNCLDAAVEANRAAGEVWFTIRRVAVEAIPGIAAYREQFEGAVREREKGKQGGAERRVVKRIQRVLAGPDIQALFCRDNGIGLNADRMKRILTEGNTDKSEVGAGAFGIGHLTAFAASDLRFIHYAGRSRCDGILRDVASAHAVLASRTVDRNSGRGAHGFWLLGDDRTLFHPHPYPNTVPHLLRSEIECLEDTGSVVGVIGFNGFRSDEKPVDAISRVAAKNFLVAIWNGSMVVHIRDETTSSEETVDRERLERILDRERNRKRAEQGGGWLSGEQAYRAWKTLETGRKLRFEEDGVSGYFRSLSDGSSHLTRSWRLTVARSAICFAGPRALSTGVWNGGGSVDGVAANCWTSSRNSPLGSGKRRDEWSNPKNSLPRVSRCFVATPRGKRKRCPPIARGEVQLRCRPPKGDKEKRAHPNRTLTRAGQLIGHPDPGQSLRGHDGLLPSPEGAFVAVARFVPSQTLMVS